ncbi:MAG: permease prefix domain 2-containing transporter, partial [Bacteroidota bacterium]
MNSKRPKPPSRTLRFLRWFCREDYLDEVEGDLIEIYEKQYQHSPSKARRRFLWSVLGHFHPEFFKTFQFLKYSNPTTMIRHNILLAFRNFRKYVGSFTINLVGLSTGIACTLLVYLWVTDELSIDKFHEKEGRIFQVLQNLPKSGDSLTTNSTPGILAEALKDEFPEVEHATSVITPEWFDVEKGIINYQKKYLQAKGQFAEPDYLDIFSWELIRGERNQVLEDKYAVLVSEEMAIELFGI